MKALKIVAAAAAALVLLLVAAAAVLFAAFDPNDYKGYVAEQVETRTGRSLAIEDDLELTVFPYLAVQTGGVTLGNPPGFDQAEPFAAADRVAASVRLLPLLQRRVEIGVVRLDGLELNLARDTAGRGNWEDFGERQGEPDGTSSGGGASWLDTLDAEGLVIDDASVAWREPGRAGPRYTAHGLRIETGAIRAGEPVDVSLALAVVDTESRRRFDVESSARVLLPMPSRSARPAPAAGRPGGGADAAQSDPERAGDGTLLELHELVFALTLHERDGSVLAESRLRSERLRAAPGGRVDAGPTRADVRLPATNGVDGLDVAAQWSSAALDPAAGSLDVAGLTTDVAGVAAEWRLEASDIIDAPRIEGSVAITDAPLAALGRLGIDWPDGVDPDALGTLDAAAQFQTALSLSGAAADAAGSVQLGPYRVDSLRVAALEARALGLALRADAEVEAATLRGRFDVPAFTPGDALRSLAATVAPQALDVGALSGASLSGRVEADLADGRLAFPALHAALLGAELDASLELAPRAGARRYRGTLRTSRFEADRLARFLGELLPQAIEPDELGVLAVDTGFDYDADGDRLSLDPLSLEVFGLAGSGSATLADVTGAASARGHVQLEPFSPRELMRRFGQSVPETSDPDVLRHARIAAGFDADAEGARFTGIDMQLDDSRVSGDFTVDGFSSPAYAFALEIDRVDADRYLPPRAPDAPDDAATAGDIELPAGALANLEIDGRVAVGRLALAGLRFDDVATGIAVGDGRAVLEPARAKLYGGEFDGSFRADTVGERGLTLSGRAASLELEPIIVALTGDANLSGTGDFDLRLAGTGATVLDNVHAADGDVSFAMRDGAIEGFNLGRTLCAVYNAARSLPAPAEQPDATRYQLIRGSASVQDGVASTDDLLARSPFMDVTGRGRLVLVEQRLDYTLEARLTGSIGIDGCESMDALIGESIPLTLRGTVTDPQIRPDFGELIERRVRDEIRDRVTDRLRDLLR